MFISQSVWREKREKNDEPWGSCESVIKYVNNKNTVLLEEENNCRQIIDNILMKKINTKKYFENICRFAEKIETATRLKTV